MRKNKFLAALAIAACLATSLPLSANAATIGQATNASKVVYGTVSDDDKAALFAAFDADYYAKENPDVVGAGFTSKEQLFNHFVTAGIFEGRSYDANFNVSAYKSMYSDDLVKAFGDNIVAYYMHWLTNGKKESRKATIEDVTKFVDVYSFVDGTKVASKVVVAAPASSSTTETSTPDPTPSVTSASDQKIHDLEKKLEAALKALEAAQKAADKATADAKAAADKAVADAKAAAEKAKQELDDFKNAQGDKTQHAQSEAEKYDPNHVKTATTLSGDIKVTSVAAVPDGATEVKFRNNVWYNYKDGKFYAPTRNAGKGGYSGAELVVKEGYIQIGGQYYELYDLDAYDVKPYVINLAVPGKLGIIGNDGWDWNNYTNLDGSKRDRDGAGVNHGAWAGATDNLDHGQVAFDENEHDRILLNDGNKAVVPYYVNANGTKKYMELVSGAVTDTKWADQKGYFDILGDYVTTNPMTFDANDGKLSDYWVNVNGTYFVKVSEQTTYLDKSGDWNYKRENGNAYFQHVGGMALNNRNNEYYIPDGPDTNTDLDGFVRLNTDKKAQLQLVRSPYLREVQKDDLDAYQYSMRFVSNVNADPAGDYEYYVDPADLDHYADINAIHDYVDPDPADGVEHDDYDPTEDDVQLGQWQQDEYYLFNQYGYYNLESITEGSWGSLQNFYAQQWTRFETQDDALVAWYNVHYTYGGPENYRAFLVQKYLEEIVGIINDPGDGTSDGSGVANLDGEGYPINDAGERIVDLVNGKVVYYYDNVDNWMITTVLADLADPTDPYDYEIVAFRMLHIDEYYELIKPRDGFILCLADDEGFAVAVNGAGTYDRVDGSRKNIPEFVDGERQIFVREFEFIPTSEYKKACNQNLLQFHKDVTTGKYYVDPDYEGAVWYDDGVTNWMSWSDSFRPDPVNGDPRFDDFQKMGYYVNWDHREAAVEVEATTPALKTEFLYDGTLDADAKHVNNNGYQDRVPAALSAKDTGSANGKWLDETGIVPDEDNFARLKGSTNNKHGYVYVHVTIYNYNEDTHTLVVDPTLGIAGEDRWYKTIELKATRDEDALYDANSDAWYYNKPVRESVATEIWHGAYDPNSKGIVEVEVKTLAEAFDLSNIDYPIFKIYQARENGRFYAVRDYSVVGKN